jgi:hypothetical protein
MSHATRMSLYMLCGVFVYQTLLVSNQELFFQTSFFCVCVWAVLGFECRAFCLLGKLSVTWAMPLDLLALGYFFFRWGPLFAQAALGLQSSFLSFPHRYVPLNLTYLLSWGLNNFFPRLYLNCNPPYLCLSSSWDYRYGTLHLASLLPS